MIKVLLQILSLEKLVVFKTNCNQINFFQTKYKVKMKMKTIDLIGNFIGRLDKFDKILINELMYIQILYIVIFLEC